MRDMKVGQQAFFYHSNTKEPGIAGIIEVCMCYSETINSGSFMGEQSRV